MTADRFAGVWMKLARAKHHVADLNSEIGKFWESNPYRVGVKGDPHNSYGAFVIDGDPEPIPDQIFAVAGDAAHNLRAASDHFAYASVKAPTANTTFPVWRKPVAPTSAQWDAQVKDKLRGASADLIQAVKALQPYQGGQEEWLWVVHDLDITDKHKIVLAVASVSTGIIIDTYAQLRATHPDHPFTEHWQGIGPTYMLKAAEATPIEKGAELLRVDSPTGYAYDGELQFPLEITLSEPQVVAGQPICPLLTGLIEESEKLLQRLALLA